MVKGGGIVTSNGRPQFATNEPGGTRTVAGAITEMIEFEKDRPELQVSIASAFFNVGGWQLISDALRRPGRVRILLGAEPQRDTDPVVLRVETMSRRRAQTAELEQALEEQEANLRLDRDLVPFTPEARGQVHALIEWLRSTDQVVEVRRYTKEFLHGKAYVIDFPLLGVIAGSSNFTYAGLSRNRELNLGQYDQATIEEVSDWFQELWDAAAPFDLAEFYSQQVEPVAPWLIFLRMLWEAYGDELRRDDIAESTDPSLRNLLEFQRDGVARARRILESHHGVLIADEVGLGKTYVGGALVKDTANSRQRVLIVAPKVIRDSVWKPYVDQENLGGWVDVISYDDLIQDDADGNATFGLPATRDPDEFSLVVLDEAHTVRNTDTQRAKRLGAILKGNPRKRVVLLTATPVNNKLGDLHSLLSYFIVHDDEFARLGIPSLAGHFAEVERLDSDELSPEHLFDILDAVAVRRTRRFVRNHYVNQPTEPGGLRVVFPDPVVRKVTYELAPVLESFFDDFAHALGADRDPEEEDPFYSGEIPDEGLSSLDPRRLTLAGYTPSRYLLETDDAHLRAAEVQVAGLLRSGLLKRFESSSAAFISTCRTMATTLEGLTSLIRGEGLVARSDALRDWIRVDTDDPVSIEEWRSTAETVSTERFREGPLLADIESDVALLRSMANHVEEGIKPQSDPKLAELAETLAQILALAEREARERLASQPALSDEERAIRDRDDRKVVVFSYFADTIHYLQDNLTVILGRPELEPYRDRVAFVTGSRSKWARNSALTVTQEEAVAGFAPRTGGPVDASGQPRAADRFDLLFTTDVLSEGVNLQQAHHVINFDLPWNPMRLVQRHGRVDRIGSQHDFVYLWCFFPDTDLDRMLRLEEILHRKLVKAANSIGVPKVLPGMAASDDRVFNARMEQIEALVDEDPGIFLGTTGTLISGEEFRALLRKAIEDESLQRRLDQMPWGVGSGFVMEGRTPGIVFCARVLDLRNQPMFRWVPREHPRFDDDGNRLPRELIADSLTALTAANPPSSNTAADLPADWIEFAYEAWVDAQADIVRSWNEAIENPAAVPAPPAIRAAVRHLSVHNEHLSSQEVDEAIKIFQRSHAKRVNARVQAVMRDEYLTDQLRSSRLLEIIDEEGLALPEARPNVFPIKADDVHLIAWVAVRNGPNAGVELG